MLARRHPIMAALLSLLLASGVILSTSLEALAATVISENFDGATPPNLPAGWTSTAPPLWGITNTTAHSGSRSAHVDGSILVSNIYLTTPSISLSGCTPSPDHTNQLSFQHRYRLAHGRLELSINGGAFQDVASFPAPTGSATIFQTGGYNGLAGDSGGGGLLNGLVSWEGQSPSFGTAGAFDPVIVNIPTAAIGQGVQFRWRYSPDTEGIPAGWFVETVHVTCDGVEKLGLAGENFDGSASLPGGWTQSVANVADAWHTAAGVGAGGSRAARFSQPFYSTDLHLTSPQLDLSGCAASLAPQLGFKHLNTLAAGFSTSPGDTKAGTAFATQPVGQALDDSDAVATDFNGTITLSIKSGTGTAGASLGGTVSMAARERGGQFQRQGAQHRFRRPGLPPARNLGLPDRGRQRCLRYHRLAAHLYHLAR